MAKRMRSHLIALIIVLMLVSVPAYAALPGGDGPSGDTPSPSTPSTSTLFLRAGTFDPLVDAVPGPAWLHSSSTHPYYILQFDGPPTSPWVEAAASMGVSLLQYLPDNAFFARIPRASLDDLRNADGVRYIGPIHPAFRIHPALWDGLRTPGVSQVDILAWDPAKATEIAGLIASDGGGVTLVEGDLVSARVRLASVRAMVADATLSIRWVEPHLDIEPINDNDARTARARQASDGTYITTGSALWSYNPTTDDFEGYTGANVTVAVADTGLDTGHPGFSGRIVEYYDYGNDGERDTDGHGTHVAGTVLGDGSWRAGDVGQDGKYAGLAPEASLVVQEVFVAGTPATNGMGRDAETSGATISSNSWISGYFGEYNGICEAYDRVTHDANNVKPGDQPIFYVFGAGNDGYYGLGSIRPPSLAKNVLSVGSTGNDRWYASSDYVSDFSSRGPAEDGRIKPDVVIPGHVVASARSSYPGAHTGWSRPGDGQDSYVFGTGTSMATPGAAGAAAVATQYLRDVKGMEPSPALLKAVLINGATPLSAYDYPSNIQGWGRVDLAASLLEGSNHHIFREDQKVALDTSTGSNVSNYWMLVKAGGPLKVTLVWSDVPGTVNSDKHLINDLDLELIDPTGRLYSGNHFSEGQSVAGTVFTPDRTNNVEGFLLESPATGLWQVQVRAYNIPQGTQSFALVASGNIEPGHVDLTADQLAPSVPEAEELSTLAIATKVRNLGNRDAPAAAYRLERDTPEGRTEVLDQGDLGAMDPKAAKDLSWTVTGGRGTHTFRLVIDPQGSVIESEEGNNIIELRYFFKGFDVDLSAPSSRSKGDPGQRVELILNLRNDGNVQDEIGVTVTDPPPGWTAQLDRGSLVLDPDGLGAVRLSVLVPSNATAGEVAYWTVTATSGGNATKTSSVRLEVEANQIFGLEVTALSQRQDMLPGEERRLELLLRNPGNGLDVYDLALAEALPAGWYVELPDPVVEVDLRSELRVSLLLTAPEPCCMDEMVEFIVTVSSSSPGIRGNATFSARIIQFFDNHVEVLDHATSGNVGERVLIPLLISNRGNGPVSYSGDINFPDASWIGGLDATDMTLQAYSEARVNLTFTIPSRAISGSYMFPMVIIPSGGDDHYFNISFSVRQFHELSLEVLSSTPTVTQGDAATLRLRLTNGGNGIEPVSLTGVVPPTWTFAYDYPEPTIDPFADVVMDLNIETEALTPGGTYDVELLAYYGEAQELVTGDTARVVVRTRPDLHVVSVNLSETRPTVDMMVRITITVSNSGETVARDVLLQVLLDGLPLGPAIEITSLESLEEETYSMLWRTNSSGIKELRVVVDYPNDVSEYDETNNEATFTLTVERLDLKTSPGASHLFALAALASAAALGTLVRRRRRLALR